ncbi:phage protease [Alicyclobacillus fastidiosus]|uniref:Phage protease n=1 Tax=Alicyclobacillus fastidiosus TaxID=392011 RepID=A0ABV5AKK6_9BACL|nr:phage protease [Alicyclobacillus fastidiosus]WEH12151.1 phage protease [Alicyclobacillus fastidiosus]
MTFMSEILLAESAGDSWIQIMKTGKWQHPQYGPMEITQDDLQKFKENFDNNVRGIKLFVDVNHDNDHAAVGEFKELRVEPGKLMAKVGWTANGADLIKSGKYRYFSPEFAFSYKDPESGKEFKDVLLGGGITNRPFLKGMDPIELSEDQSYGTVWFSEKEYDPDGDGDNDATTNPQENHDWMLDVLAGITPWPHDEQQQAQLRKVGATRQSCDAAYRIRQKQLRAQGQETYSQAASGGDKQEPTKPDNKPSAMSEAEFTRVVLMLAEHEVKNAHKSPPKGKPQDRSQYADSDNYKYPIDKDHIQAAVDYFNQDGQQKSGGYSDEEWAKIGRRIANAANKLIGKGHAFKDGKIATNVEMDEDPNPDDAPSCPNNTDDVDAGQFSEPASHTQSILGGGSMTTQPQNPQGSAAQGGTGAISLAEYNALQQEVRVLKEANRRSRLSETVNGFMFNESTKTGKILPAQRDNVIDLMMGMNDDQVAKFSEFINGLPDAIQFNQETGTGNAGQPKRREALVEEKAAVLMSEKGMDLRAALIEADALVPREIGR